MHFLEKGQKIRAWEDPPPSFGQYPFFSVDVFPNKFNKSMYVVTLTTPRNNLKKSMYQFWQIHLTSQRNPINNFSKNN